MKLSMCTSHLNVVTLRDPETLANLSAVFEEKGCIYVVIYLKTVYNKYS